MMSIFIQQQPSIKTSDLKPSDLDNSFLRFGGESLYAVRLNDNLYVIGRGDMRSAQKNAIASLSDFQTFKIVLEHYNDAETVQVYEGFVRN